MNIPVALATRYGKLGQSSGSIRRHGGFVSTKGTLSAAGLVPARGSLANIIILGPTMDIA